MNASDDRSASTYCNVVWILFKDKVKSVNLVVPCVQSKRLQFLMVLSAFTFKSIMARSCLMAAVVTIVRRSGVRPVSAFSMATPRSQQTVTSHMNSLSSSSALLMSSTSTSPATTIAPRVKTADATSPSDGPVLIKGWVRTVRKQKTLAFVEVNDGSNLSGIQCVLTFDDIDDYSRKGARRTTSQN